MIDLFFEKEDLKGRVLTLGVREDTGKAAPDH